MHGEKWRRETADVQYKTPAVEKLLIKYQQPDEADKMNKIQKEIGTLLSRVLHVRVCACVCVRVRVCVRMSVYLHSSLDYRGGEGYHASEHRVAA